MKTKSLKETVCVLYMTVCEVCVSDDVVYTSVCICVCVC